jgi:hypothetical protein
MARGLRRLAMALGALPVRTWQASSAKVTSRRRCSASIPQGPPDVVGQAGGTGLDGTSLNASREGARKDRVADLGIGCADPVG